MDGCGWRLEPQFLPGKMGPLFALGVKPSQPRTEPRAVLFLPPFGEEMNKCRPMMAAQARRLAQQGIESLLIDLCGTGDSYGDFSAATWEQWLDDLDQAWRFLSVRVATIHLLAVRSGSLLVGPLAQSHSIADVRLVLWQPIVKGADYWRQILRLRVAADSLRGDRASLSPQQLLQRDGRIEIAGYDISAKLAEGLSQSSLTMQTVKAFPKVLWAETAADSTGEVSPGAARVLDQWRQEKVGVSAAAVQGEPFWTTTEIAMAPKLLDVTTEFLTGESVAGERA